MLSLVYRNCSFKFLSELLGVLVHSIMQFYKESVSKDLGGGGCPLHGFGHSMIVGAK